MELLKRHAFTFKSHVESRNYEVIMNSIDNVLHLSHIFGIKVNDPGSLLLEFIVSIVWQLVEAALEDEGLLELTGERKFKWNVSQEMEIDGSGSYGGKRNEYQEILQSRNTVMAVELVGLFLQNKVTSRILFLARRNMPTHWRTLVQDIEVLAVNSSALRNSKILTPEILLQLISDDRKIGFEEKKANYLQEIHTVMSSSAGISHKVSGSSLWISIDLVLEDAMDGSQVDTTSAIEIITRLVKALQALNGTSWHDCFLGLWMAALRLVQRERDPIEGPMPRLDTRLCMLLSIIPLVVSDLIEDEESVPQNNIYWQTTQDCKENRCRDLVSSLQILGDYQSLLTPPKPVIAAANQAAAKALMFVSGIDLSNSAYFDLVNMKDMAHNFSGNLHHLIVETCIARNLLDTSAYFWPGYATSHVNQIPHGMTAQVPGWSTFMKGAPLTPVMMNAFVSEPARILCGASLIRGWNVEAYYSSTRTRVDTFSLNDYILILVITRFHLNQIDTFL